MIKEFLDFISKLYNDDIMKPRIRRFSTLLMVIVGITGLLFVVKSGYSFFKEVNDGNSADRIAHQPELEPFRQTYINPILYRDSVKNTSRYRYDFHVQNIGNGQLFDMKYKIICVDKNMNLSISLSRFFNKTDEMKKGESYIIGLKIEDTNSLHRISDMRYVAYEITYNDSKRASAGILHKIFRIDTNFISKPQPVVTNQEYDMIEKELIEAKFWQK